MARQISAVWDVGEEVSISEILKGAAEFSYGVVPLENMTIQGQCKKCGLGTVELMLTNNKDGHLHTAMEKAICAAADKIRKNNKIARKAEREYLRTSQKTPR